MTNKLSRNMILWLWLFGHVCSVASNILLLNNPLTQIGIFFCRIWELSKIISKPDLLFFLCIYFQELFKVDNYFVFNGYCFFCPALTKLALNLHINYCVYGPICRCYVVCFLVVFQGLWLIYRVFKKLDISSWYSTKKLQDVQH